MLSTLPGSKAGRVSPGNLKAAPAQVKQVPLTDLRECASEAVWCTNVRAATVGDNDWWTFTVRLRQAAVDGNITFWGRRYVCDYGKDFYSEPLRDIPRKHFEEFGFYPTRIAQVDNYDIFTQKLGDPPSAWKGSIFRDLHVNPEQAQTSLKAAVAPPPSADIAVSVYTSVAHIRIYQPACSLVVEYVCLTDLEECLVEMADVGARKPIYMPTPFVLRTYNHIRSNERRPFALAREQRLVLPLVFCFAQVRSARMIGISSMSIGKNISCPQPPRR